MKHVIENVLEITPKTQEELNYCIYLIDRDYLPHNESDIVSLAIMSLNNQFWFNFYFKFKDSQPFCLIYKQMCEILDDQNDFESYYLTTELYEYLKCNLKQMVYTLI